MTEPSELATKKQKDAAQKFWLAFRTSAPSLTVDALPDIVSDQLFPFLLQYEQNQSLASIAKSLETIAAHLTNKAKE